MKYSVFTVVMGEYAPEEVVKELHAMGYDGVEWRVHEDYHITSREIQEKAGQIRALTEAHGLEIPLLGAYLSPADIQEIKKVFEAARAMNCPAVRIRSAIYDGKAHFDEVFEVATNALERVAQLSNEMNVRALLEIHSGTIIPSASAAYRLLSQFNPHHVGVIFDPANMILEGMENWQMGLEILGDYLAHVHVKNIGWFRREEDGDTKWNWEYTPLDKGIADWEEIVRALDAVGYDGYLSVEDLYGGKANTTGLIREELTSHHAESIPTLKKLKEDLDYLKALA